MSWEIHQSKYSGVKKTEQSALAGMTIPLIKKATVNWRKFSFHYLRSIAKTQYLAWTFCIHILWSFTFPESGILAERSATKIQFGLQLLVVPCEKALYRVRTGLKSTWIWRTFLKSPWKLNLPWKVLENLSKALKSAWILLFSVWLSTVDRGLNQYKMVVPIFGAAYAAPNKGTSILY